jgi:hypothetical protein
MSYGIVIFRKYLWSDIGLWKTSLVVVCSPICNSYMPFEYIPN